jgi:hypothetical protein
MNESPTPRLHYDRRAPEPLLAALSAEGDLHGLVELALSTENATKALDLQLRANPRRPDAGHATLYVGLTRALDLEHRSDGRLRVRPQTRFGPGKEWDAPPPWTEFLPLADLVSLWPEVISYAQATIDAADARYTRSEGGMQAVLSNADSDDFAVIDREAVIGFDARVKDAFLAPIKGALSDLAPDLLDTGEAWARERHFGDELDALAIDSEGTRPHHGGQTGVRGDGGRVDSRSGVALPPPVFNLGGAGAGHRARSPGGDAPTAGENRP